MQSTATNPHRTGYLFRLLLFWTAVFFLILFYFWYETDQTYHYVEEFAMPKFQQEVKRVYSDWHLGKCNRSRADLVTRYREVIGKRVSEQMVDSPCLDGILKVREKGSDRIFVVCSNFQILSRFILCLTFQIRFRKWFDHSTYWRFYSSN